MVNDCDTHLAHVKNYTLKTIPLRDLRQMNLIARINKINQY